MWCELCNNNVIAFQLSIDPIRSTVKLREDKYPLGVIRRGICRFCLDDVIAQINSISKAEDN